MGSIADAIRTELLSWEGVTSLPHRFGGVEYLYGRRELGHVHGERLADLPLPRAVHDQVIADGRAQVHHVLPDTGWVSCWIESEADVPTVLELFRLQYDRYRGYTQASST